MTLPIILFGYDSSPFTTKVRLTLRVLQLKYTYVVVPSMMPRPVLHDTFGIMYRKIPVCCIGRDIYIDTSIIIEALEHHAHTLASLASTSDKRDERTIYPLSKDGYQYRTLIRGFASYWTDRPFFRVTTGLIPSSVWKTRFGKDRAGLIGHALDAEKLDAKVVNNMAGLDMHLSMFETHFSDVALADGRWFFSTTTPSLADISLYYQLSWGVDMASGRGIHNLTAGGTPDTNTEGVSGIFNRDRYPHVMKWFEAFEKYIKDLPVVEMKTSSLNDDLLQALRACERTREPRLLPLSVGKHTILDKKLGLVNGVQVSVVPDDTGRGNPTFGTLVALTPEEIVIEPTPMAGGKSVAIPVHLHFPRLGFVVKPAVKAKI